MFIEFIKAKDNKEYAVLGHIVLGKTYAVKKVAICGQQKEISDTVEHISSGSGILYRLANWGAITLGTITVTVDGTAYTPIPAGIPVFSDVELQFEFNSELKIQLSNGADVIIAVYDGDEMT